MFDDCTLGPVRFLYVYIVRAHESKTESGHRGTIGRMCSDRLCTTSIP